MLGLRIDTLLGLSRHRYTYAVARRSVSPVMNRPRLEKLCKRRGSMRQTVTQRQASPVLERSIGVSKSNTWSFGCSPRVAAPAAVALLAPAELICCCITEEHQDDGGRLEDVTPKRTRPLVVLTRKPATCLARSASDVMVAAERMCMVRGRWSGRSLFLLSSLSTGAAALSALCKRRENPESTIQ